uniref:Uncharacterized protein n=1 Tax=Arundo donax TaxID=35708 RepID=A0A0A9U018_ARUDO
MHRWTGTGGPPSGTSTSASLQSRSGSRRSRSRLLLRRFRLTTSTLLFPPPPPAAPPPPNPSPAANGGAWGAPGCGSATEHGLDPLDRYDDEDANVMDDEGSMADRSRVSTLQLQPPSARRDLLLVPDHHGHVVVAASRGFGSQGGSLLASSGRTARFGGRFGWFQADPRRQEPPLRDPPYTAGKSP